VDRGWALVLTLAVGGLVAFQPPANALLARHTGDLGAAFVSIVISLVVVGSLLVLVGRPADLGGVTELRPVHLLGGIGGAAVVFISLVAVKSLGAGGVAAALVCTQLIVSAVIDRYGWLGLPEEPLTFARVAGIGLLIAGTLLVTLP
jgi:transporter family-2 protein